MTSNVFTSESVCAGHPDKVCDQISDAILDEVLRQDPNGRVAVETAVTANRIILLGELTTTAKIDFVKVSREQVKRLGYTDPDFHFTPNCDVEVYIRSQSPEIAAGVDLDGAGDQGMMFGYACHETKQLMPLPIMMAHSLTRAIDAARESGTLPYLRPDGKAQVTIRYENDMPVGIEHITMAVPHNEEIERKQVHADLVTEVVLPVLAEYGLDMGSAKVIVNGTGVWHAPGPASDAGLTGRKIIVDSYGGYARVGGGAFSGKDPTKVDRSGAYAARFLAKNIVASGMADRCEVGLAYFIGAKQPVMHQINTFGTAKESQKAIAAFSTEILDTSVKGIIAALDLRRPIYLDTAAYGHFGRDDVSWEKVVEHAKISANA
ncbi:MAG TPA: methionine adenosyltransferase [Candidatus Saccharimonadia bacterium]